MGVHAGPNLSVFPLRKQARKVANIHPPPIAPQQPTLPNNAVSVSIKRPHGYPAPVLPNTAPQKPAAFNGQLLREAWPAKQRVPKDHPREKASAKKAGAFSVKSRSLAG